MLMSACVCWKFNAHVHWCLCGYEVHDACVCVGACAVGYLKFTMRMCVGVCVVNYEVHDACVCVGVCAVT